jgi:hypothetical protein
MKTTKVENALSLIINQVVLKSPLLKARHNNLTLDLVILLNEERYLDEQERDIHLSIDSRTISVFQAIEQLNLINTQRNTVIARTKKIREQQGNACDIDNENQKMLKVLSKVCKNFASASKV